MYDYFNINNTTYNNLLYNDTQNNTSTLDWF